MKSTFFLLVIVMPFLEGCSKQQGVWPVADTDASIYKTWELDRYTIKTDGMYHSFSRNTVNMHALRTLRFERDGSYHAAAPNWSGRFNYYDDSSRIFLTPDNPNLPSLTFHFDYISAQQIQWSSPTVTLNPQDPNASEYEQFVAFQGKQWLYNRNIDASLFKSIQIQFTYSETK